MGDLLKGSWPGDSAPNQRHTGGGNPPGGDEMERRVTQLETHVYYIGRDLHDVKQDVKGLRDDVDTIKRRLAYMSGAGIVVLAVFAWIANNRFDQLVDLIAK